MEPTIYDYGFDLNLNKEFPKELESSLVYDINDRLNKFVVGDTLTTTIPGLLEAEYNGI